VLYLKARLADGRPLPNWVRFDARRRLFRGIGPQDLTEEITITVIASDVDGMEATSRFVVRRHVGIRND
jgi:hypothetical protein